MIKARIFWLPALALALAAASTGAFAQVLPMNCALSSSTFETFRTEAVADFAKDFKMTCTGGPVLVTGSVAPQANISLTFPVAVTSRLVGAGTLPLTESLLYLDEPAAGQQFPCTVTTCPLTVGAAFGASGNKNVYQAVLSNANTITFLGVPIFPTGSPVLERVYRFANIRLAAADAAGTSITAAASVTGAPPYFSLSPSTLNVGFINAGHTFSLRDASDNPIGAVTLNGNAPLNPSVGPSTQPAFLLKFINNGADSFQMRNPATSLANPSALQSQAALGFRTSETGYYAQAFPATNGLNLAGLATQGTRLTATFTGLPAGVTLYFATQPGTVGTSAAAELRLVNETTGAFIPPTATIAGGTPVAPLTAVSGSVTVAWELFGAFGVDGAGSAAFPVVVSYASAGNGTTLLRPSLGPVDTGAAAASSTLPVPRFRAPAPITAINFAGGGTPPTITTTSLPAGQQALPYSFTLGATGGLAPYSWSAGPGVAPPGLTLSTAGVLSGIPTTPGDHTFTVRVTGADGFSSTRQFTFTTRPRVSVTTTSLPGGLVNTAYGPATLAAAGGLTPYTWAVTAGSLPAGLNLSNTGGIAGTPATAGTSEFTATVTDGAGQTASATLLITINAAFSITTPSVPIGQEGIAYGPFALASVGGTAPVGWGVTGGALPAGIVLSGTGVLNGTPTASGTFGFTVTATDAAARTAQATFSLVIRPRVTVTTTSLPNGVVGATYPPASMNATGGLPSYTWSIAGGSLPAGLSMAATGGITGIPTTAGSSSFTARVTDGAGQTADANLTITILAGFSITSLPVPPGQEGVAYGAVTLASAGGAAPVGWQVTAGGLPAGLALSTAGVLSGTPSASGTFAFSVTATDATGRTAQASFSLLIRPRVTVTTTSLPAGQIDVAYGPIQLQTAGGTPRYSWTVTSGALPAGLTLSFTGAIGGTPTASGTFSFTATVTDSTQQTAQAQLSIAIAGANFTITSTLLPNGQVGAPYNATLTSSGGANPVTWTRTAGALPQGLTLGANGAIGGTPASPGLASFGVQATDATGRTAQAQVTIEINSGPQPPALVTTTVPVAVVSEGLGAALRVTGGCEPYVFSAAGLPAGVQLSRDGRFSGSASGDGVFPITITVTDCAGASSNTQVAFRVNPALSIVSPGAIPDLLLNRAAPLAFSAAGGVPPYTWSLASGSMGPGMSLDAQGLARGRPEQAGVFNFTIEARDSTGQTARRPYSARVLPNAACTVSLEPGSLKFTIRQGSPVETKAVNVVGICEDPIALNASVDVPSGRSWLGASGGTTTRANAPGSITVNASPGNLPPGTYTGFVRLSGRVNASIPVTLTVTPLATSFQASPVGLTFTGVEGGPNPASQSVSLVSAPLGNVPWTASGRTTAGGSWLDVFSTSGVTDTGSPGVSAVPVRVSLAGLTAGEYYGVIDFTANNAQDSIRQVTVVLLVLPANGAIAPTPDVTGLVFTGAAAKTVTLTNPSRNPIGFTLSRHSPDGPPWFTVDFPSGSIAPGGEFPVRVRPDLSGQPGVRRGFLLIRFSNGESLRIELLLVIPRVVSQADPGAKEMSERAAAGCTPSRLVGVFTNLPQNFSIPTGWPSGVEMLIVDDCGDFLNSGSAVAGFSCCDNPKPLVPLRQGRWSGTWVARASQNTELAVTSDFANDPGSLKGSHTVTGTVARAGNPPVINPSGAVSAASAPVDQPLAPGMLLSVYGSRFADETRSATVLPLSTTLGVTSVSLGGRLLPLYFTSDGQVNALAPLDVPRNTELSLIVRRGAALSVPETVTIAPSAPAVFAAAGDSAFALDLQGRPVNAGNPAARGSVVALFVTGLGAVDRTVAEGAAAPTEPLARTIEQVDVAVGGAQGLVLYSGLAPGLVAVYQINVAIPAGSEVGDAVPLVVKAGEGVSSRTTLAVR